MAYLFISISASTGSKEPETIRDLDPKKHLHWATIAKTCIGTCYGIIDKF